jgi:hypothetical protein
LINRFFKSPLPCAHIAEVVGSHGIAGIYFQGMLQLFAGDFEVALLRQCIA